MVFGFQLPVFRFQLQVFGDLNLNLKWSEEPAFISQVFDFSWHVVRLILRRSRVVVIIFCKSWALCDETQWFFQNLEQARASCKCDGSWGILDLQGSKSVETDTGLQGEPAQMRERLLSDPALIYFTDPERFIALFRFGQLQVGMSGRWGQNLKLSWIRFCFPCIYSIGKVMDPLFSFLKQGWALPLLRAEAGLCFRKKQRHIFQWQGLMGEEDKEGWK